LKHEKCTTYYVFFYCCIVNSTFGQTTLYQNIINGGVTVGGVNTGDRNNGIFEIVIEIPPFSSVLKSYLITLGDDLNINDLEIKLNSNNITLSHHSIFVSGISTIVRTSNSLNNSSINSIEIPSVFLQTGINYLELNSQNHLIEPTYNPFIFVVVFENINLTKSFVNISLNNKDVSPNIFLDIDGLAPVNSTNDVGFSFVGKHFCDTVYDGSYVHVNGNNLGLVGGNNYNSNVTCAGTMGNFSYFNNTLYGLGDGVANNFMSGPDAVANIQPYINNNDNQIDFNFIYQRPNSNGRYTNPVLASFLAYSTPCDTFSAELLTKDTTVCIGESVQLSATGGQKFKWQPSAGLSCDTCANPIASPLESTTYTVRIFNNDSCSKVYPVRVNISQPKPDTITTERSICGEDNGKINVGDIAPWRLAKAPITYTINGDTVQGPEISNISPGNKELVITDANGCQFSDSIFIDEENITVSRIMYLSAEKGNAPLEITARGLLVNYISNHVFVWIVNGDTINTGNSPLNYTFDQPGEYELIHITYNQYPHCADTVKTIILVFPDFFAQIPNVFSPNADGINDAFEIKISNTQSISWQIKNRWGNLVSEGSKDLDSETQKLQLWNGDNASDGVYFYTLTATDYNGKVYEKSGSVSLLR
jgi:gliding motility-associated-like protein